MPSGLIGGVTLVDGTASGLTLDATCDVTLATVTAGDYIEIKGVQPTWATNPLTTIYGGYVYIE